MKPNLLIRTFFAALVAATSLAGSATAATVEISGSTLTVRGATGEENGLTVSLGASGKIKMNDTEQPISSFPPACANEDGTTAVECPMPTKLVVELGDMPDVFRTGGLPGTVAIEVYGGPGTDDLHAGLDTNAANGASRLLDGGDGNDKVIGSDFADTLRGGAGDDEVKGWGGADAVEGGEGNDTLSGDLAPDREPTTRVGADVVDGGGGLDTFRDYDGNATVAVTMDGAANDGRAGEGDNLKSLEEIDTFVAGTFDMGEGDEKVLVFSHTLGLTTVRGNGGVDWLEGEASTPERFEGGAGADHLEGGWGDDVIVGGSGQDTILGDSDEAYCGTFGGNCTVPQGNDVIEARDGEVDLIDCGVGTDRAVVDANDVVANCETVEKPAGPGPGPGPVPPGGKTCKVPKVAKAKQAAALKKIKAAGCKTKVKKVKSKTVKKGRVVKTSPKAGKVVAEGTTVTVYVSKGKR
jgi:Ca2+-binding RTX toxin-like protein